MSRFARRQDSNQGDIVKRLKELGCTVRDNSRNGDGGPDLTIGFMGRDYFVEIKAVGKGLSQEQCDWHQEWRGQRPVVMWTPEQAEAWVAERRKRLFEESEL